jgi:hypothetical protein
MTVPFSVEVEGVAALARGDLVDVDREDLLEEGAAVAALDPDAAHVGEVEEADAGADGRMLVDDARVLDGHLPAVEVDHPALSFTCAA